MQDGAAVGDSGADATLDVSGARDDETRALPDTAGVEPRALALALADGGGAAEPLMLPDTAGVEPRARALALADGGGAAEPLARPRALAVELAVLRGAEPLPEVSANSEPVSCSTPASGCDTDRGPLCGCVVRTRSRAPPPTMPP